MLLRMAMDYVKTKISQYPVYVFSKSYCPYCDKAKQALDSLGAKYVVEEIENKPDVDDIQKALGELTGATTVPRVFIGGKCIGGGTDTANLLRNGKLAQLLKSVGAI